MNKEIILDFRKHRTDTSPLYIHSDCVERVHTFTVLGTVISANLSWSANTSAVIKTSHKRLHFPRVLRKTNLCMKLLVTFYCSTTESILAYCIMVWFSYWIEADRKSPQRVVKTAQRIVRWLLPSLKDIYSSQETAPILHITCLTCYPLAGTTDPSQPEQSDSGTASFHKPSLH